MAKELHNLKDAEPRKSTFTLEEIRRKISGIKPIKGITSGTSDEAEAILCLANEIQKIKDFLTEGRTDKVLD